MSKREKLRLLKLKTNAELARDVPVLVEIADSANSPIAAYEKAYLETGDVRTSLACKALAKIKRDYGKKPFDDFMLSVVSVCPDSHKDLGTSKGEDKMSPETQERKDQVAKDSNEFKQPELPLKHITYRAAVNGVHSRVRVIQQFSNDAEKSVEAVYVFPLPDEATVVGCKMKIGDRTVDAELKAREEARQEYEQAIEAGHHGALMEQERPNIFTMNVGGIEPGEQIDVEIDYVQRVPWQAAGARFTIPTVVAPRFVPGVPMDKQGGGWSPDTTEVPDASKVTPVVAQEGVSYNADINISFAPGFRCQLTSPSHPGLVTEQTLAKADTLEINTGDITTDRDFILAYRSVQKMPTVAVHTGAVQDETFVLASIIPPGEVTAQAMDINLLLDRSGSMQGPKMSGLKQIAKKVLAKLKAQELDHRVGVVIYDNVAEVLCPLGKITDQMISSIDSITARGGTETGPALTFTHQQFGESARAKAIMLISDGQTFSCDYQGSGVPIYTVGIDSAVNDSFLKDLARTTNAAYESFYPGEDYSRAENTLVGMLSGPVLRDITLSGAGQVVGVSDVFQGRPATLAVRFSGEVPSEFSLQGKQPDGKESVVAIKPAEGKDCDFAAQVWAREFIRESHDKQEQIEASLKYGVICQHTSFVAISLKEVPGQKPERVEIPVNLPHTWDYGAVFGSSRRLSTVSSLMSMSSMSIGGGGPILATMSPGGDTLYDAEAGAKSGSGIPTIRRLRSGGSRTNRALQDQGSDSLDVDSIDVDDIEVGELRFTLDSEDLLPCLIAILTAADSGDSDAKQALADLNLTVAKVEALEDSERAIAYYFVCRLAVYGLQVRSEVKSALAKDPGQDEVSQSWHNLTKKELGQAYDVKLLSVTDGSDEYVAWKFGRGERPTAAPWSLVP